MLSLFHCETYLCHLLCNYLCKSPVLWILHHDTANHMAGHVCDFLSQCYNLFARGLVVFVISMPFLIIFKIGILVFCHFYTLLFLIYYCYLDFCLKCSSLNPSTSSQISCKLHALQSIIRFLKIWSMALVISSASSAILLSAL